MIYIAKSKIDQHIRTFYKRFHKNLHVHTNKYEYCMIYEYDETKKALDGRPSLT